MFEHRQKVLKSVGFLYKQGDWYGMYFLKTDNFCVKMFTFPFLFDSSVLRDTCEHNVLK